MYEIDVEDTYGIWSFAFVLPALYATKYKTGANISRFEDACKLSYFSKLVLCLSFIPIFGEGYLKNHWFSFHTFPVLFCFTLLCWLYLMPNASKSLRFLPKDDHHNLYLFLTAVMTMLFSTFSHYLVAITNYTGMFVCTQLITVLPFYLLFQAYTHIDNLLQSDEEEQQVLKD